VYQGGETTDGRRIYVGNINYDFREEEIRQKFNEFGNITSLSYKQGFAFVDYADRRDAEDAIASMNGKTLGGRTITVELSGRPPKDGKEAGGGRPMPSRRESDDRADQRGNFGGGGGNSRSLASSDVATRNLFVGNIPPDVSEADVQDYFSKFGPVTGVKFLPKKSDTIAAFVDFQNVDNAREAHAATNIISGMKVRTDYNTRRSVPPPSEDRFNGGDRYDDRSRYDDRPPRYDPPPSRYDDRDRDYYDRGPPPRYDDRPPPRRYDYDDRGPPPPRYDDRGPPPPDYGRGGRYDDRYDDRGPPPPRYEDRGPPPRYESDRYAPPPSRYDRYDDRERGGYGGPPPPRYDERINEVDGRRRD